jgi:hypothetical protein
MSVRHRRAAADAPMDAAAAASEDGGAVALEEPLLGERAAPAAPGILLRLWRPLLDLLLRALDALERLAERVVPPLRRRTPPPPPPPLARRLAALRARAAAPFDAANPAHAAALERLWIAALAPAPFPFATGGVSPLWKDVGFQGTHPGTDFRGGGFLALELLAHAAEGDAFPALRAAHAARAPEASYPLAAAGVVLTAALVDACDLRRAVAPATPAGRGLLRLLRRDEAALEAAFIATLVALEAEWVAWPGGADYFQFQKVLAKVRGRAERALASRRLRGARDLPALLAE